MMQTVTLETAQKLKEAGYPQGVGMYSFVWALIAENQWRLFTLRETAADWVLVAAPTAGELMEWIKQETGVVRCESLQGSRWAAANHQFSVGYEDNPAEALGLLAIQILKGGDTK